MKRQDITYFFVKESELVEGSLNYEFLVEKVKVAWKGLLKAF